MNLKRYVGSSMRILRMDILVNIIVNKILNVGY
jgi:hypothetical protein